MKISKDSNKTSSRPLSPLTTRLYTIQAITQRCECVRLYILETERKHEQKLNRLPARVDINELKKKWVVNIYGRRLQGNEISLLRKELNFAITPHTIPTKDIVVSVEAATCHLMPPAPRKSGRNRAEIYGALKHAKPPKRRTLKELATDQNIVIIRADKGNCTVQSSWREQTTKTRFKKCCKIRTSIHQSLIKGATQCQERSLSCRVNFWI